MVVESDGDSTRLERTELLRPGSEKVRGVVTTTHELRFVNLEIENTIDQGDEHTRIHIGGKTTVHLEYGFRRRTLPFRGHA